MLLKRTRTGPWIANYPLRNEVGDVVAEIDFALKELRIAIEVDGRAFHSDRSSFERDRRRQNLLVLGGWCVLRFTWEQITRDPEAVIACIVAAVAQRRRSLG
ncbi:MAG: endonuclease domain-containing protein [Candidatus Nanopelagicales bacterium]